jgi:hypothetical protein
MSDSRPDTLAHIALVRRHLYLAITQLHRRAALHDASKLVEPEKSAFDEVTPRLDHPYGSPAYADGLRHLREALDHHYAHNSHHPEHHPHGVAGMTLVDLVEMLCDWKAASERQPQGDFGLSLAISFDRFHIEPQLRSVLENTAAALWPCTHQEEQPHDP